MIDTAENIEDLKFLEEEYGNQTFTWKDTSYLCIPSAIKTILSPDVGTVKTDKYVTMTVRMEQFTDGLIPQSQQSIVFKDSKWTIMQVDRGAMDTSFRLTCIEAGRGTHG